MCELPPETDGSAEGGRLPSLKLRRAADGDPAKEAWLRDVVTHGGTQAGGEEWTEGVHEVNPRLCGVCEELAPSTHVGPEGGFFPLKHFPPCGLNECPHFNRLLPQPREKTRARC